MKDRPSWSTASRWPYSRGWRPTSRRCQAYRRLLALSHMGLGIALSRPAIHAFEEAEQRYRWALKIWDQVEADFPDLPLRSR